MGPVPCLSEWFTKNCPTQLRRDFVKSGSALINSIKRQVDLHAILRGSSRNVPVPGAKLPRINPSVVELLADHANEQLESHFMIEMSE